MFGERVPGSLEERNEAIATWSDEDPALEALLEEVDETLYAEFDALEIALEGFVRERGLA